MSRSRLPVTPHKNSIHEKSEKAHQQEEKID